MRIKRLKPPIDKTKYKVFKSSNYSKYQQENNNPSHYTLELMENGFDKVTYFQKIVD